jgi:hypothetical protein
MKQKIAVLIRHGVVGLSALFAFTGQAMAATSDFKSQAASANTNFGDGFINPQPQICGDCKHSISEKFYFPEIFFDGTLPPSFDNENKYSIPEKTSYGNSSLVGTVSVFGINDHESSQRNGAQATPEKSIQKINEWSSEVSGPESIFKDNDDKPKLNDWAESDHDRELGDELGHSEDDFNVSPVPEASEWTLLLAGFALVGFIANRRKRSEELTLA